MFLISQIIKPILGMFVLIWMHSSCWFQYGHQMSQLWHFLKYVWICCRVMRFEGMDKSMKFRHAAAIARDRSVFVQDARFMSPTHAPPLWHRGRRSRSERQRASSIIHTFFCVVYQIIQQLLYGMLRVYQCISTSVFTPNYENAVWYAVNEWILVSSDTSVDDRTNCKRLFIVIDLWLNKLFTEKFLWNSKKDKDTRNICGKTIVCCKSWEGAMTMYM